jgi:hypothetical protein
MPKNILENMVTGVEVKMEKRTRAKYLRMSWRTHEVLVML